MPVAPIRLPWGGAGRKTARVSKQLHRNVGMVSLLTAVSRVLGLARDSLAAAVLGAGLLNAAFVTAFRLPNLFRRLLGEGSLTAAFLPTLQHELHEHGTAGAFKLLNNVVSWLAAVTGAVVAVAMLALSQARLLGLKDEKWQLVADLSVVLFPYLAFVCVAAAFNATLNVLGRFTEPALSPIWLNLAMIASLGGAGWFFATTPESAVRWLCAGVLVGGFLQMTVPAVVLMRAGWQPRIDFARSAGVREIAHLMTPGFFGTAIYQVNIFVSSMLAYSLTTVGRGEAPATLMFYANRLMELPIGVFAIAVATVVYPLLAKHAAAGDYPAMGDDLRRGVRLVLLLNIPAAAGLALLSGPITRLLFQHGQFTGEAARAMAPLIACYAIGLPFFSITSLLVRTFYSMKDTRTPVRIAVVDFGVNLILSVALMLPFGAIGLVVASTCAVVVQAELLRRALVRRRAEITLAPLIRDMGKILAAAAVMAAVVAAAQTGLHRLVGENQFRWRDALTVGLLVPLAVVVYTALLAGWGMPDIHQLWTRLKRRKPAG